MKPERAGEIPVETTAAREVRVVYFNEHREKQPLPIDWLWPPLTCFTRSHPANESVDGGQDDARLSFAFAASPTRPDTWPLRKPDRRRGGSEEPSGRLRQLAVALAVRLTALDSRHAAANVRGDEHRCSA